MNAAKPKAFGFSCPNVAAVVDVLRTYPRGFICVYLRLSADPKPYLTLGYENSEFAEQLAGFVERQPHDAGVAALEPRDEGTRASLDGVRARLVERLPRLYVRRDARVVEEREGHQRFAYRQLQALLEGECDRREHAMLRARERSQDAVGVGAIGGLAEDLPRERHGSVGREHGLPLQSPAHHPALPRRPRLPITRSSWNCISTIGTRSVRSSALTSSVAIKRRRSAMTSRSRARIAASNASDQRRRAASRETNPAGFTMKNCASEGNEAARETPGLGLRANAPQSTTPATCGSLDAQRAATSPENDSATRSGRESAAAWLAARRA